MPERVDFTSQRLLLHVPLHQGATVALDKAQRNYLVNVLRMREGEALLVFNGRDGEWQASLTGLARRDGELSIGAQIRRQPAPSPLWLCFAPVKGPKLDFLVQKAVEMGAGRLVPTITNRTQVQRLNPTRMQATIVEAAEQCGVLAVPDLAEEVRLAEFLKRLPPEHLVIFCDEWAPVGNPALALAHLPRGTPAALLIGPEGGFDREERDTLLARDNVVRLALGPRILRAETAAIAALAAVQIAIGDWVDDPVPNLE